MAVQPDYVLWRWAHVYGAVAAYRPYRATTFSEAAFEAIPVAMKWPRKEWVRRLRTAERMIYQADIEIADNQGPGFGAPQALAPLRREPPRAGETWEQAVARTATDP